MDKKIKMPKININNWMTARMADVSANQYSTQWQRLSQMQQSASILLAILAISISLMFSIINIKNDDSILLGSEYWKEIFIPAFAVYCLLIVLAMISLLKVIWPKIITKDLPNIKILYNDLEVKLKKYFNETDEGANIEGDIDPISFLTSKMIEYYNEAIESINSLVEKNQINYTKGLFISVFSLTLTLCSYIFIFFDIQLNNYLIKIWYGVNLILGILSLLIIFFLQLILKRR